MDKDDIIRVCIYVLIILLSHSLDEKSDNAKNKWLYSINNNYYFSSCGIILNLEVSNE